VICQLSRRQTLSKVKEKRKSVSLFSPGTPQRTKEQQEHRLRTQKTACFHLRDTMEITRAALGCPAFWAPAFVALLPAPATLRGSLICKMGTVAIPTSQALGITKMR
jgi:hypothetical protein